jgi:hypothetical protein
MLPRQLQKNFESGLPGQLHKRDITATVLVHTVKVIVIADGFNRIELQKVIIPRRADLVKLTPAGEKQTSLRLRLAFLTPCT